MKDMFNNYIFHLAYESVKKDKKSYIISFVMMIIAFTFTIVFTTYINTNEKTDTLLKYQKYGHWNVAYQDLNEGALNFLKDNNSIDILTTLQITGEINPLVLVSNYNEEFFELASIKLEEGRLPSSNNEIVGMVNHVSLNDEVIIDHQTFKVVGLINEYDKEWDNISYHYFTYYLPPISTMTYIASDTISFNFHNITNNQILNDRLNNAYPVKEFDFTIGGYSSSTHRPIDQLQVYLDTMNMFILLMGSALFVSIAYNSSHRDKTIFLLRCIGMNKKDVKKYIFYEMILVMLIALSISIVLGFILSLILCYILSLYSKIFIFSVSISLSIKYILYFVVLILFMTYVSILTIDIQSMDSLIQKKNRTKLKKYKKSQKMSIFRMSQRIANSHSLLYLSIVIILNVQLFTVASISDYINIYQNNYGHYLIEELKGFHYLINGELPNNYDELDQYILEEQEYHFVEGYVKENYGYDMYDRYTVIYLRDLSQDDYEIVTGEKYKDHQIYTYKPRGNSINDSIDSDTISFYIEEPYTYIEKDYYGNEIEYTDFKEVFIDDFTIGGEINVIDKGYLNAFNNVDSYYVNDLVPNDYVATYITDINDFPIKGYSTTRYIHTSKDISKILVDHGRDIQQIRWVQTSYFDDQSQQKEAGFAILMLSIILLVSMIFMYFIVVLLVNTIDKDIRLLRCLGMTFKQTILLYFYMFGFIVLLSLGYVYAYFNLYYMSVPSVIIIPMIINLIIVLSVVLHKTTHSLVFYPTDVERYY